MSDLISREALLESLNPEYVDTRKLIEQGETHLDNLAEGYTEVYKLIKCAPTVDAIEVVRCKECKHFYTYRCKADNMRLNKCDMGVGTDADEDFFCSYGERKENINEVN